MTQKEKREAVQKAGRAIEAMPEAKRQYILGYMEGVLAMEERKKKSG